MAGGREKVPSRRLPITPLFKTIRTFEGNINAEKTVFIAFNKLFTGFLIFTPCLFSRRCWLRKRYPRRFLAHFLVHFPSSPSFSTVFSFKVGTFFFFVSLCSHFLTDFPHRRVDPRVFGVFISATIIRSLVQWYRSLLVATSPISYHLLTHTTVESD